MKKIKLGLIIMVAFCAFAGMSAGAAVALEDRTGWTVRIDTTYLAKSVVSEEPVTLSAEIYNAGRQRIYDREISYSIVTGGERAEIKDGNRLYVKAAGKFTVKAAMAEDGSVFSEYESTAYELTFSNIEFLNRFENITVYTQPIVLQGSLDISGVPLPEDSHYELKYTVVSGPAEIYCDEFLRITGKGKVVVSAASVYDPTVSVQKEFDVTDPDEKDITGLEDALEQINSAGCGSTLSAGGLCLLAGLAAVLVKKRRINI